MNSGEGRRYDLFGQKGEEKYYIPVEKLGETTYLALEEIGKVK